MKEIGIWNSSKWVILVLVWLGGLAVGNAAETSKSLPIAKYRHNAKAAVSYTFDDGLEEHYTKVMPRMDSLGIKGTFWIIGRVIEQQKSMRGAASMTWEQVKTLGDHGHEIASHSYSHTNFKKLSHKEIDMEIERNDSVIFVNTGYHPHTLAYPGNRKTDKIVRYVEAHESIMATRTEQLSVGGTRIAADGNLERWLFRAIDKGTWAVGMTHGISIGYDHFTDENILWRHLKWAKSMHDVGILWIGTFAEVASYVRGMSEDVTYILEHKPVKVTQKGKKLTPYRSWDGKWCVDGKRGMKVMVDYGEVGD